MSLQFECMSFIRVRNILREALATAPEVRTERWQGVVANNDTFEIRNVNFEVPLLNIWDLDHWRKDIQPSLPWADDHFLERVGGEPLNPGVQWRNWPYALRADKFRDNERFNHSYMERLWPKFARRTEDGTLPVETPQGRKYPIADRRAKFGVANYYGDLQDLVDLLASEPYTRQAWIPLFFPEDTGISDGGRKMCSLGYQIIVRDGEAHIWYPLRSCDFVRHWADDCYLAVRLLMWIVEQCKILRPDKWDKIKLGTFAMHCTSLHIFRSDLK